jgi:hypothetical protein
MNVVPRFIRRSPQLRLSSSVLKLVARPCAVVPWNEPNSGGVSMSKFAIGEHVDTAAYGHEDGTVIAVFPTVDGSFRYAVDMEGYGALQFFTEKELAPRKSNIPSLWQFA